MTKKKKKKKKEPATVEELQKELQAVRELLANVQEEASGFQSVNYKLDALHNKAKASNKLLRSQLSVMKKDLGSSTILVERLKGYHDAARPYVSALEINRADRTHPVEYYAAVSALEDKPTRKLLLREELE
jgi:small-conductance mechanosensitive channel